MGPRDALNSRNLGLALKLAGRDLEDMGKGGQIALFHRIVRHARQLLSARDLIDLGVSSEDAMARLKIKEYPWKKLRGAASEFTAPHLRAFLRDAQAMEILAKRADQNLSPEAFLADLLIRLLGVPGARRR